MPSRLEQAMEKRREAAEEEARTRCAKAQNIIVSFGFGKVVVDYFDGDGLAERFLHTDPEDEIEITKAETSTKIKRVVHA